MATWLESGVLLEAGARVPAPVSSEHHLHGITGNFGWKMKWYIPFHLKHFTNYRLPA